MQNKEIRGLMHKKASKDQYMAFVSSSLELSHYSLSQSLSWSLRVFLEHSSFGSRKEKRGKGKEDKQGSRKGKQDQEALVGILVGDLLHV